MSGWKQEPFDDVINKGHFQITQSGPLHAPIRNFSIRRNERLRLILETEAAGNAESPMIVHPPGTVRINTDTVELTNISGIKAIAVGVQPINETISRNYESGLDVLREQSQLTYIESTLKNVERAAYTIDWLENLQGNLFVWPGLIRDGTSVNETRTLKVDNGELILIAANESEAFSRTCVSFFVCGGQIFLCANWQEKKFETPGNRGCLIYVGTPDENTRTKIREALSFSLGMYLVYLGSTVFDENWQIVSFKSVSPYVDKKVFELPVLPPAPLGARYQREIDPSILSRAINSIYSQYDNLNFGALSWAYWHALCAPLHISAVHFGAAIESLQRRYVDMHGESIQTKLIPQKDIWRSLRDEISHAISKLNIPEQNRNAVLANVGALNRTPPRVVTEQVLKHLNLELGKDEEQAWKRRNNAAHGADIEDGSELLLIRDTKLLKTLFHRMILSMTNANDRYYDYCTVNFPIRSLREPVPPSPQ